MRGTDDMAAEQNRKRVKTMLAELNKLRYAHSRPAGPLRWEYGDDKLKPEFSMDPSGWRTWKPGDTWGGRDSYVWFYVPVTIPDQYDGKGVMLTLNTGASDVWNTDNPQIIVYVNGEMKAAMDMNHTEILLGDCVKAGEVYETAFYAYSNSRERVNFFDVTIGVFHPLVEKLYYDMKIIWEAAELIKEGELERIELFQLLNDCVNCLDLRRTEEDSFFRSVKDGVEYLKEHFYETKHGISPVTVHGIGHTHIDVAWKWRLKQTRQKVVRSFLTVLNLMDRYPEYRFMSSQPQLYEFVKEEAPRLYERIKGRIQEGRWETEGAMWVEADCNLISGESIIRQILYGKRFFKQEFHTGGDEVMWLPDTFGFNAAMPQILRKSGIKYFVATKMGWNEYNRMPNDTMLWRGLDGSEVLAYFITTSDYCIHPELVGNRSFSTTYNGTLSASQVMGTWQRYQNKGINQDVLTCYGWGDGGGGSTAAMVEEGRRLRHGVGRCPVVKQTSIKEFFHLLERNLEGKHVPKWSGELYLETHRGTYTSMAQNKKYNRRCELLNMDAEFFSVLAMELAGNLSYPKHKLERAWKLTLLNQFHDILPGTSCKEVYEDSKAQYEEVLELDQKLMQAAWNSILNGGLKSCPHRGTQLIVFNTLGFSRTSLVKIQESQTKSSIFQKTWDGSRLYLAEDVAAKGLEVRQLSQADRQSVIEKKEVKEGRIYYIGTRFYDMIFNSTGELSSLYDREACREVFKEGQVGNRLTAFEDRPEEYDAWNIDAYYEEKQWDITKLTKFELLEDGPLRACVYSRREFMGSVIEQYMYLYNHTKRIDFHTHVDWKEHQTLLKVSFPVDILTDKAVYEVPFGHVERPTHRNTSWEQARFEVCTHKWADVSEYGYGVALLNDCKYGMDIRESVMRLSLIKAGIYPNPDGDIGRHEFTYSLYPHKGDFREGRVIQEAYDLNSPLYGMMTENREEFRYSYITAVADNILADSVKQAEDGDGIIIRLYEAYGKRTRTKIHLGAGGKELEECGCMEQPLESQFPKECGLSCRDSSAWMLTFGPYEIKTLRIRGQIPNN